MTQISIFTPDQVAAAFDDSFLDLVTCRQWLFERIHEKHGAGCPFCNTTVNPGKATITFWVGGRVCCSGCKKYFTARTNTILAGTDLEDSTIFCLAVLLGLGMTEKEVAERLDLDRGTVRQWREKLTAL